jgi:Zn-dependent alcohol dehydrogenase
MTGIYVEKWPVVFGVDGAGVVEEVGEGVEKFKEGDEAIGIVRTTSDKSAAFQVSD